MSEITHNPDRFPKFADLLNLHRANYEIPMGTVIRLIERAQESGDSQELLDGQGLLMQTFGNYSEVDQKLFAEKCMQRLEAAISEGRPYEVAAFVGYVGIARDFGGSASEEGSRFWEQTVLKMRELHDRLEELSRQDPSTWEDTFNLVSTGMAWMEVPHGATAGDPLREAQIPKILEEYDLVVSMSKLDKFINGELGIREVYGPGGMVDEEEHNPLLNEYDLATSVAEKALAAANYLERAFREDMPGEFEVAGTAEEISDKAGKVRIRCTPRAKRVARIARVVSGIKKVR